ncbi:alpha/beta-hydrolase [Rickenella mellea]|uniref:Alpha/beta-hydrolase n=1 Tax=Rickenella mellea TaxID=50990 RepID=A0A4Y7PRB5_9AGAM|nr:alpha/beta-hydrolase [Rickenella mellea]
MRTSFFLGLLVFLHIQIGCSRGFNPRDVPKRVAKCKAINRKDNEVKDIEIHYADVNPKANKTLVMVHGWPSLWSTWSNQIEEFQNEYHIIAPDNRGFGSSTHPGDVESSGTMGDLVGDLVCVLHDAGVKSAVCLGHDWGAQICWEAARMRPDIFSGVVAAVVPYISAAGPFIPIAALIDQLPRLTYQLFFSDNTSEAIAELDRDIRRTLRATLRSVDSPPPESFLTNKESFLHGWHETPEIDPIPFFTEEEEEYMVEQYSIQGFQHSLQFYTHGNRRGSWTFGSAQGNHSIPQPALSILPTQDPVADWHHASKLLGSEKFIPHLTVETIDAAHWPQLEKPNEFNVILRKWLDNFHYGPVHAEKPMKISDEL